MPKVSIAAHGVTIYCAVNQVGLILDQLNSMSDKSRGEASRRLTHLDATTSNDEDGNILSLAVREAKRIHEKLVRAVPELSGRAATNFGTALRVKKVRSLLAGDLHRGVELSKWLEYIASAADAQRHLTSVVIHEVADILDGRIYKLVKMMLVVSTPRLVCPTVSMFLQYRTTIRPMTTT